MKREIVFATNNANKVREIRGLIGKKFEVRSLREIGCMDELPETRDTLEGNAIQKAEYVKEKFGYDCFADDTGLEVEALDGRPGVYSARYAGTDCNADDNIDMLLAELEGENNRKARFRTVIAFVNDKRSETFEGRIEGEITRKRKGSEGFGYDPVFVPVGYDRSFAEMSLEEKNKISHRANAFRNFADSF